MSARILLVEDEPAVRMIVGDLLRNEGYAVEEEGDGEAALARGVDGIDLMVVDVMMPGLDGFEVCQRWRERGFDGAILMLTARGQLEDRVEGLTRGADDYLPKPFEPPELLARVGALLRRVRKDTSTPMKRVTFGDVEVDFARQEAWRGGTRVNLAGKELQLLRFLVEHRGQVVNRDQLLRSVWSQQPYITPRTVDTHVAWLRQKLEANPQTPRHILTVRGEGYRFER